MNETERLSLWNERFHDIEPFVGQVASSTARRWSRLVERQDVEQELWASVWDALPEFVGLLDQDEPRLLISSLRRIASAYTDAVRAVVMPDWQVYGHYEVARLLTLWAQRSGRSAAAPDDLVKITTDEVDDTSEELADLARGLAYLADGYRRALVGRALVPGSWAELAALTGDTEGSLRTAHSRAMRKLVSYMNGQPETARAAA